jgi:hypothetical protein
VVVERSDPRDGPVRDYIAAMPVHEDDDADEALLRSWIEQSSRLPGAQL